MALGNTKTTVQHLGARALVATQGSYTKRMRVNGRTYYAAVERGTTRVWHLWTRGKTAVQGTPTLGKRYVW